MPLVRAAMKKSDPLAVLLELIGQPASNLV
jgi:hypothetical protein